MHPERSPGPAQVKFEDYQTLGSLQDYVLISTGRAHLDHYTRIEPGAWMLRSHGKRASFSLGGCGVTLHVDALYDGAEIARQADQLNSAAASPRRARPLRT